MENTKATIRVTGMTCGHCEKAVEHALLTVPGVTFAAATREQQQVLVEFNPELTNEQALRQAIERSGYKVA
jgi:copper chaperone